MKRYTLGRHERLKSKKELANLFAHGKSFNAYPLRLVWREREANDSSGPVQFAVSVPKKKFPKAVQRNHLKRLVREAYRYNKPKLQEVLEGNQGRISFFIIYLAKEQHSFRDIERAMQQLIGRFSKKWKKMNHTTNPSD